MGFFDFLKSTPVENRIDIDRTITYYADPKQDIKDIIDGREGQTIISRPTIKKYYDHDVYFLDNIIIGHNLNHWFRDTNYEMIMGYFVEDENGGIKSTVYKDLGDCFDFIGREYEHLGILKIPKNTDVEILKNSDELFIPTLLKTGADIIYNKSKRQVYEKNGYIYAFINKYPQPSATSIYNPFSHNWTYRRFPDSPGCPLIYYGVLFRPVDSNSGYERNWQLLNSMDVQKISAVGDIDGLFERRDGSNLSSNISYLKGSYFDKNQEHYHIVNIPTLNWQNPYGVSLGNFSMCRNMFIFMKNDIVKKSLIEHVNTLESERIRVTRDDKLEKLGI